MIRSRMSYKCCEFIWIMSWRLLSANLLNYIQNLCRVPFGLYKKLPVTKDDNNAIRDFIVNMKDSMDTKIYGHKDTKDHIVRLLAQWISNPESKGLVIGIQGSMGTGKTTLIKDAICKVLGLPFAFIPLGGISDGSFLTGHSYTYEGSMWGNVVDNLMKCGCMNPVFFFDELDKVSCTHHGDEIINILIHMTDASQNDNFRDKYFSNIEFDISRSLIIFSYNNEQNINPILKDRMVRISTNGYSANDKVIICEKHMIPSIMKEFGFKSDSDIVFSKEILKLIISQVTKEEGVRNLKRALYNIVSNLNLQIILQ
ncbi:MAG: AAA family ATPase [Bacteroidetes bacterium]|nr:AAA family ATPase [Bacteroidota bacterium]